MTTHRIQIDVSSDIFDKVIGFLEKLPKSKVKLNLENQNENVQEKEIDDIFTRTAGLLSLQEIDPLAWQKQIRSEWDR